MNPKKIFASLAVFTFLVTISLLSKPVTAQTRDSAGFAISPPSFEINSLPGDTLKNTIKVENLSSQPLKIKVSPENFVAYGEGGQVALTEEGSTYSISQWIGLPNNNFTIKPKSFALVDFSINIPRNAEPGSHYGAVVFSTVADQTLNGTGAVLAQEIGSLILIKLPGKVYEDAKLLNFSTTRQIFWDTNIEFNALIQNKGNVHIKPYGFISVYNIFGKKVASVEVKARNILPGSRRLFTDQLKFNKIGFFTSEINLLYSGGGKIIKAHASFFAFNEKTTKQWLLIIGAALIVYALLRKRINTALRIILTGKVK